MRLRNTGRGPLIAYGITIERGAEHTFTEMEAKGLLSQAPHVQVEVVEEPPVRPFPTASRQAWAAYADLIGVAPEGLTRDQIVAAIDAANAPPEGGEPEAEPGAGEGTNEPNEEA